MAQSFGWSRVGSVATAALLAAAGFVGEGFAAGLGFEQLAALRAVREAAISPDGSQIAYALEVPRRPGVDPDGPAWRELHVVAAAGGQARVYVGGEVKVSTIRFSPDGRLITYLAARGDDEHAALWAIPLAGGESRRLLGFTTEIRDYRISPDGATVAFVAAEPEAEARTKAREAGFTQEVFEEDWAPARVWLAPLPAFAPAVADPAAAAGPPAEPRALALDGSAFHVRWSPDGALLAVDLAPRPLVDDEYMHRRVHVVEAATGAVTARLDNPGKLGEFAFSPDGRHLALISAADRNDPSAGRLLVAPAGGGPLRDVLPALEGDVVAFAWQDPETLMFLADEGEESRFAEVDLASAAVKTHASSTGSGALRAPIMSGLSLAADGRRAALVGDSPSHPAEVFVMGHGDPAPRRLGDSNPWLAAVELAPQEVFAYQARDGLPLRGVLLRPLAAPAGPAPLLLMVHGGPEAHRSNGWLSSYGAPAQIAAAGGYAVYFPNYRGSTGRGVAFSKLGQGDAAGAEFDDLVDAVDALIAAGVADRDRVGITGGSYGGYATAWCATRYSERFRAGVMFVGISNEISKGLTTEIPVEDREVHTLADPWTKWQFRLERSPIFHAEKSRTALLIAGGTADTRVHPAQSLQLYRALKLLGRAPVRYVRYPGEGHGNARAASRDDYARRLMRWMDHFVKEGRPGLPPWELGTGPAAASPPDEG